MIWRDESLGECILEKNKVALTLFILGILEIVICFIIGFVSGQPEESYDKFIIANALYWWIGGFVSGMLVIGLSELLNLLQQISDNTLAANNYSKEKRISLTKVKTVKEVSREMQTFSEDDFTYNGMKLYLNSNLKSEGALVFSGKTLSFLKGTKNIFEIYNSQINSCEMFEENNVLVEITYINNFGNLVKVGLYSTLNTNQIGNEIYDRIHYVMNKQKK
jgi:uncharacterized protein YkvS